MVSRFDYLIKKIDEADFLDYPFRHIEISNFFSEEDFEEIITSEEINTQACCSDEEVFESLFLSGYKLIPFPGAITDHVEYIENRKKNRTTDSHSATESSGIVLRLTEPKSDILIELKQFIESNKFNSTLAEKFDLSLFDCSKDCGIQKYLDEYEISPHPDLRKKALTFMLNINNSKDSDSKEHHTHYLKFKPERKYVQEFWKGNPLTERCWVPWSWCETVKQQRQNNSIVIFSPSHDTMHAVKAAYCHLDGQRTQVYGNLWFKEDNNSKFVPSKNRLDWWDFDFTEAPKKQLSLISRTLRALRKVSRSDDSNTDFSRKDHY